MAGQSGYLFFAIFDDEQAAGVAASAIHDLARADNIHVDGLAAVHRDVHGHVHLHEIGDITGAQGAVRGSAAGGLVGLLFPPAILGSAAVGTLIGSVVAKVHDKGFRTGELHELGEQLGKGQSAVIFIGDQETSDRFQDQLKDAERVAQRPLTGQLEEQMTAFQGAIAMQGNAFGNT